MAHQKCRLLCPFLHLEQENTKHVCNQINKFQEYDQSIKQCFQESSWHSTAFEFIIPLLPVSTYTKNPNVFKAPSSTTSTTIAPPLQEVLDLVPSQVPTGHSVSVVLQRTQQAWTWIYNLLFPRIYFRARAWGQDLRCNPTFH